MDSAPSIVQEILRDREAGAARLVAECRESLRAAALSLCGDSALAEDLVFRTFERVLDHVATCRDESAFDAWMKAIMRNEWLMTIRGATTRNTIPSGTSSEVEGLAEPAEGAGEVPAAVNASLLRDAIEELPDEMREALLLRYFMGLPLQKAAKILAVPVGTVKSRLHYARALLAAKLGAVAKKPGGKALLVALALFASAALGAVGVAVVRAAVTAPSATPAVESPDRQGDQGSLGTLRTLESLGSLESLESLGSLDNLEALENLTASTTSTTSIASAGASQAPTAPSAYSAPPLAGVGLPGGYIQLEYVASSGTQYLDTGVFPKANTRVVCDFRLTELPAWGNNYCGWGSGGGKETFFFGATRTQFSVNISGNWKASPTGVPVDTERHVYDLASGDMRLDGTLFSTTNTLGNTATSSETMYLFATHIGWGSWVDYHVKMAIYSCKIYEGATLVRDFVPARRVSDGAIGLYDVVNDRFHASAGTGTLAAGPEASLLTVVGDPAEYGTPTPGYGLVAGWEGLPDGVALANPLRFTMGVETNGLALGARFSPLEATYAIDLTGGDWTVEVAAGCTHTVTEIVGNASANLTVAGGGTLILPDVDLSSCFVDLVIDGVMVQIASESQLGSGNVIIRNGGGLLCTEGFTQRARKITIQPGSTGVVEVVADKTVVFKPDYFSSASATLVKRGTGRLQMEGAWQAAAGRWIVEEGKLNLYGTLDAPPLVEIHEGAVFLFHRNLYQIAIGDVVLRGGSMIQTTPWMSLEGKNLLRLKESIGRLIMGKVTALPSRDGRHSYVSTGIFYHSGTSDFDVQEGAVLDLDTALQPDHSRIRSLRKTGGGTLRLLKSPFSERGGIFVAEGTLALAGHNVRIPRGVPLRVADGARLVLADGAVLDQAQDFPGGLLAEAAVWFDATQLKGFGNGSAVAAIPNLGSAGGAFMNSAIGPAAPLYRRAVLNGMPALDGPPASAGSGLKLVDAYSNTGVELSTYVVAAGTNITFSNSYNGKNASPFSFGTPQGGCETAGGFRYEYVAGNQFNVLFSGNGSKMAVSNDAVSLSSGPFLSATRRDATTATLLQYRGDGVPEFTQETTGTFPNYDISTMGLFMKMNDSGSIWSSVCWPGQIGEVLVFSRRLTDAEDEAVRGYLAKKWFASAREWAALPAASAALALPVAVEEGSSAALCLDNDGDSAVAKLGGGELVDFSASRGTRTLDVRAGRAAFAPASNAWCPAAVWFDADDPAALVTNASGAVLSVRNKGWAGGEFTPTAGETTCSPTTGAIGGRPAVVFDGDDFLRTRAFTNTTPRELYVYLVRQQDAYVRNAGLFAHASSAALTREADNVAAGVVVGYLSNTQNISLYSGNSDLWLAGAGANGVPVIDFFHVGDYHVCFGELAAGNAATNVYAIRSAVAPSDADRATVNDLFHIGSRIGAGDVPSTFLKGRIGELFAFEEPLNAAQTDELINYLRKKWMGAGDGSATPPRWLANAGTEVETGGRLAVRQAAGTELGQDVGTVALASYTSEGAVSWMRAAAMDGPLFTVLGDIALGGPVALTLNPFPRKGHSRTLASYGGDCTGFGPGWTFAGEGMSGNPRVRHLSAEKRILLEYVSPTTFILLQ